MITLELDIDEAYDLYAFIKNHEREDIPQAVWDVCMKISDELDVY